MNFNIRPMRYRAFILLVLPFAIFITAPLYTVSQETSIPIQIRIKENGTILSLYVETAITDTEQQRGFMHRRYIPDGTGMLFIYSKDAILQFWMKNTPHPLSIAFIDSHGYILGIYDMRPFSMDIVTSKYPVRYALEVPQGYFERAGIQQGDCLSESSLILINDRLSKVLHRKKKKT